MSVPLFDRSSSPIQFIEDSKTLTKDIVAWSKNQSKMLSIYNIIPIWQIKHD